MFEMFRKRQEPLRAVVESLLARVGAVEATCRTLERENQERHDQVLKWMKRVQRAAVHESPELGSAEGTEVLPPHANNPTQMRVLARRNGAVLRER